MHFQDLILALQDFWRTRGCLITQPYDVEKGAGTFNPSTFLRALGPEPFNAAYVEPCRRPTDGRYGENPIRMQHYYQFQVVMKPNPDNLVELYIASLAAIGINSTDHDIRLVHDDWESPTLGAWGLGWEVWIDGMEVTQFTYFQQVGGFELKPVMGEITYGLERLCMFLQDVDSVYDLAYNADVTYGDLFHQNEIQFSRHNFEYADVSLHLDLFEKYESECNKLCEVENPGPAADYCLKASHSFNILDARGAISVNERQGYILRVRKLARTVAEKWLESREQLKFPLLKPDSLTAAKDDLGKPNLTSTGNIEPDAGADVRLPLLIEIGVEEMPAQVFTPLLRDLPALVEKRLGSCNLDIRNTEVFLTPRRILVSIDSLLTRQSDQSLCVKGPPLSIAKDQDGHWTKAALGFAKKNGIEIDAAEVRDIKGTEYLFASVEKPGSSAIDILATAIPELMGAIPWYKTMRWGSGTTGFVRPVKWLIVLLGNTTIPVNFAGIQAQANSHGHRFLSPGEVSGTSVREGFLDNLEAASVIADHGRRKQRIRGQILEIAGENNLQWIDDESLLWEVTNLVEYPFPILGTFDSRYLKIPEIVLISEMKKHQRYFPLHNCDGTLSNSFVAISNMDCADHAVVRSGYEKVVRSRFADADFFLTEDLKRPLHSRIDDLSKSIFQAQLGTISDKVERITRLSAFIAERLELSTQESATISEISRLCKTDLTTHMVAEFPELQGEIGCYYAQRQNLSETVASGIREHYLPKSLSDTFPSSKEAAVVGLADRVDSLVGIFGIGKGPTGSADPFALRRACLTSIAIIVNEKFELNIADIIDHAISGYGEVLSDIAATDLRELVLKFYCARMRGFLQDDGNPILSSGFSYDSVRSVMSASAAWYDFSDLISRVTAMETFRQRDDFTDVAATFKRAHNIIRDDFSSGDVNVEKLLLKEEKLLWRNAIETEEKINELLGSKDYVDALSLIAPLRLPVNDFFDAVLVNDPDSEIRDNRRRLVAKVVELVLRIADFSELQ